MLPVWAPLASLSPVALEHGRTMPLTDIFASGTKDGQRTAEGLLGVIARSEGDQQALTNAGPMRFTTQRPQCLQPAMQSERPILDQQWNVPRDAHCGPR